MHDELTWIMRWEERNPNFFCSSLYYNLKNNDNKKAGSLSLSPLCISFCERPKYHLPQMKLMCYFK